MADALYAAPQVVTDLDQKTCYHTMDLPGVGVVPGNFDLREILD